tara:strand:- start:464 stop:778 length:315 start_codon:yes stop_codon:yes gene_type:complete
MDFIHRTIDCHISKPFNGRQILSTLKASLGRNPKPIRIASPPNWVGFSHTYNPQLIGIGIRVSGISDTAVPKSNQYSRNHSEPSDGTTISPFTPTFATICEIHP